MSDTKLTFDTTVTKIGTTSCGCELYSNALVLCPLHAAAPDLLRVCKAIIASEDIDDVNKARDAAHYAITKAKGEEK